MRWTWIGLLLLLFLQGCGGGKLGDERLRSEGVFYGDVNGASAVLVLKAGQYFLLAGDLAARGDYDLEGVALSATGSAYDLTASGTVVGDIRLTGRFWTNQHIALEWSVAGAGIRGESLVQFGSIYDIPWPLADLEGGWINQDEQNLVFFTLLPPYASASLDPAGDNNDIVVSATVSSADYDGVIVSLVGDLGIEAQEWAEYDATARELTVHVDLLAGNPSTANDVIAAIQASGAPFKAELDTSNDNGNDGSGKVEAIAATLAFPGNEGDLLLEGAVLSSLTQMSGVASDADETDNLVDISMSLTSVGGDPDDRYTGFGVLSETEVEDQGLRPEMLVLAANSQSAFLNKLIWVSQDELEQSQDQQDQDP